MPASRQPYTTAESVTKMRTGARPPAGPAHHALLTASRPPYRHTRLPAAHTRRPYLWL